MVAHFQTDTYSTCWPSSRSLWHRWWAKARACFGQGLGQGRGNGFEGFEGPQPGLQFWTCWKVQHLNRKIIYNHLGPTSPSPAASLACPTPSDVQQSDVQQKGRWKKNIYISKRTAFHRHVWWPEGTFPMKMNGPGWKQLPISIGPGTGPSWGSIGWKLDPQMRSLGDTYARKEFRLHAKPQVQEAHRQMFLREWRAYVASWRAHCCRDFPYLLIWGFNIFSMLLFTWDDPVWRGKPNATILLRNHRRGSFYVHHPCSRGITDAINLYCGWWVNHQPCAFSVLRTWSVLRQP